MIVFSDLDELNKYVEECKASGNPIPIINGVLAGVAYAPYIPLTYSGSDVEVKPTMTFKTRYDVPKSPDSEQQK